jgi:hypothetical protein
MSMNLRHTAALALVGWFLAGPSPVRPPEDGGESRGFCSSAHSAVFCWDTPPQEPETVSLPDLRRTNPEKWKWVVFRGFHTKSACEKERAKERAFEKWALLAPTKCIASDDPRLKEK